MSGAQIGHSVTRKEGRRKVTGQARYVDDVSLCPGCCTARPSAVQSRAAASRSIHFDPAVNWDDFTVVTAADIPARNRVTLIADDQPYLADRTRQSSRRAGRSPRSPRSAPADEARRNVTIDIELLPPVLTIDEALARAANHLGRQPLQELRVCTRRRRSGDGPPRRRLSSRASTETGAQEQLYIETNGMLAVANPEAGVTVWGSMQCPYYIHHALAGLFDLPAERVRVFRWKPAAASAARKSTRPILAGHAALLAWKCGPAGQDDLRPRRGHGRDDQATPSRTRHRTAVRRRQTARHGDRLRDRWWRVLLRSSPVVLSRGTIHAAGPVLPAPTVRIPPRAWPPMRRRTARSADSARPESSSRSSAIWIRSPPPSG